MCALAPLLLGLASDVGAQGPAEPPKTLLILHPHDETLAASRIVAEALRKALMAASPGGFEFFSDYLDLSRFSSAAYRESLAQYLAAKHSSQRINLIVALGPEALGFILEHRNPIAAGVPIAFCCIGEKTLARFQLPSNAAGFSNVYSLTGTLALARALQPGARDVFIITGASEFDRSWETTAREQLLPLAAELNVTYLSGLALSELHRRLARLNRNSIVIFLTLFQDGTGRRFTPRDLVSGISQASAAPIYGPYDTYLGLGTVGGHMDTFEETGTALAKLAVQMLRGTDLPPIEQNSGVAAATRVDARQLERWSLDSDRLPKGTVVLFDDPSIWERDRSLVLGIAAAFALQTAAVLALLAQMRRRRRAESSLMESEERMVFAASAVSVAMWHVDLPDGALWATENCKQMFGLSDEAPLTIEALLGCIHEEERQAAAEVLRPDSPGARDAEFRVTLADGSTRWLAVRSRMRGENGGRLSQRVNGSVADVTARKLAEIEADLQRAELTHTARASVLGQLSGAIAHELNQPLTAILANAQAVQEILKQPNPDLFEVDAAIGDIVREDRRAGEVIRRLLGLLRKSEPKSEAVDVNEIAKSTLRLLNSELVARSITATTNLLDPLPRVPGDPIQLQQVLINLMVNAMEALDHVPRAMRNIELGTSLDQTGGIVIHIHDTGSGISPEHVRTVFQPFYTTKQQGLGLGLPICSTIINRHGGVLRLENRSSGGVRAVVSLPAFMADAAQ